MRKSAVKPLCLALAALFCAPRPAAAVSVQATNFAAGPVSPSTPLVIDFDTMPGPEEGSLALMIGSQDVGGMVRVTGERQLTYPSPELPLPQGATEVIVFLVKDPRTATEIARFPLVVQVDAATAPVPPGSWAFKPKLEVSGPLSRNETRKSGQVSETSSKTSGLGSVQAGVEVSHQNEAGWDVHATANVAGSTLQAQALRYPTRGGEASRVDLASYLVEGGYRDTRIALGQITVSGNPLVVGSLANRGAVITQRVNERLDVALSSQNGATIVGFDRFFGVYDTRSNFTSAVLGVEIFPERARALRLELSYLDAARSGAPSINAASVLAAEQSQGVGLRVLGASADNRFTGDLAWGVSRHQTNSDAVTGTPATAARTRNAYVADLGYALVQGAELAPGWPATLSTKYRREYAQPLYRSLGAPFGADYEQDAVALTSTLGAAQADLQLTRRRDNVDRVAKLMRNHVDNVALTVSVPLQQLIGKPEAPAAPWWPALTLGAQHTHQFADRVPADFPATSVPDIVTNVLSAGVNWNVDRWSTSAMVNRNVQNNQQLGLENQDIRTLTYNLNLNWRALDTLTLTAGYGPSRTFLTDTDLTRLTYNPQLGFTWLIEGGWTLGGNYNFDRATDSQDLSQTRGFGFNTTISKNFELQTPWGYAQRGQVSLRHFVTHNTSRMAAGEQTFENRIRTTGVVLTVSLNFF